MTKKSQKTSQPKAKDVAAPKEKASTAPTPDQMLIPCAFKPKADITAYELAVLLHYILKRQVTLADWQSLDTKYAGITRHLEPITNAPAAADAT